MTIFSPGQWVYADCFPLYFNVDDKLATDIYSKLPLRKLGPYCMLLATAKPLTMKEERISHLICSDLVSFIPWSEPNAAGTNAYTALQT